MNEIKFKEKLIEILKSDDRLFNKDGELRQNLTKDFVDSYDTNFISILLNNEITKEKFFVKVGEVYVFKKNEFKFFLDENKLDNSYTQYENRIGLKYGSKLLKDYGDVVLNFPYKDCVLQGGQTTDEGLDTFFEYSENNNNYIEKQAKRKEIFYNQVLARDEIDRLLEPKVLQNFEQYSKENGLEKNIADFRRDKNGTIKNNLIIKGNNLLALHSIKKEFAGKVKLIYIDPPYNTGGDSFKYNDNFNHSTWLAFIKNRLEIAKEFLREDGVIFVQCDDNEQAYLKILMDEIFTNGFINTIAVKMSEASGVKMNHANSRFPKIKEYLLFYKKNTFSHFNKIDKYKHPIWDKENNIFLENFSKEQRAKIEKIEKKEKYTDQDVKTVNNIFSKVKRKSLSKKISELNITNCEEIEKWKFNNSYRIIKTAGSSSLSNLIKSLKKITNQDIASALSKKNILFFYITDFNRNTKQPRLQVIFADNNIYRHPCDFWQDIKTTGAVADEGGVKLSGGKKPEKLLHRIIKMTTNKNDIVLDFFSGSGTSGAVAHKMSRQYILIEQLNYIKNLPEARLKNVINGEQGGISEEVGWKGGGSFIYFELAQWNKQAQNKISDCKNLKELIKLFDELYEKYFLNYNLKIREFKEKVIKEKEFINLSIERQKQIFVKMLDLNQMYVNYNEIEDAKYNITENEIKLSKQFYSNKN